jgi:hypothetical protein
VVPSALAVAAVLLVANVLAALMAVVLASAADLAASAVVWI